MARNSYGQVGDWRRGWLPPILFEGLRKRRIGHTVFAAMAALCLGALLPLAASVSEVPLRIGLILATLTVCLLPIVLRIVRGTFDLFEPIVGGTLALALLFGLRPIWMMSKGDYTYSHVYDMSTQFTSTLALGLVGSFAFVVGYEVVKFRARPSAYRPSKVASSLPRLSTVYRYGIFVSVLSALAYAIHLARGGGLSTSLRTLAAGDSPDTSRLVESSSEYLSAAPILVACAGIIIAASIQHLNRFQKAIVVAASLYPTVLFFLLGNRRFIIPSILIPVIASYFMSGRRPRRLTLLVVAPLTFLLVATIPYARTSGAREQAGGTAPIYQKALARPADVWDRFIGGVDTAMLPALGIELDTLKRPSDFYLGQASVGDVFLAPIPHVLFPSKPVTARNDMLIRSFGVPCSRAGCADFSIIGTFYQDGWWVGVGLGMLLVGVASGWVWRRRLEAPSDPRRVVVAATTAVFLPIIFRAGFMPSFTWFLMFLVPSLVGLELACRQRPGQSATPRATAR